MANLNEAYDTLLEQQAEEIKKLKEEIKKVVSKIHEMNDTKNSPTKDFHNNLSNVVWYYFKAKDDEIAKLKEQLVKEKTRVEELLNTPRAKEIEKLKEQVVKYRADWATLKARDELYQQYVEAHDKISYEKKDLKEEIAKLKEENDTLNKKAQKWEKIRWAVLEEDSEDE